MRIDKVAGIDITIGDIVRWQDPITKKFHEGFVTPMGHPFSGYGYRIISKNHETLTLKDLETKLNVKKVGEL